MVVSNYRNHRYVVQYRRRTIEKKVGQPINLKQHPKKISGSHPAPCESDRLNPRTPFAQLSMIFRRLFLFARLNKPADTKELRTKPAKLCVILCVNFLTC